MDGCQLCVCGRSFLQLGALNYHKRTCAKTKKRFSSALEKAKESWSAKKRRRLIPEGAEASGGTATMSVAGRQFPSNTQVCGIF
jgi:hypothetical protein